MNMHTIRQTLPMPRKDVILERMQGSYWFSCVDLLSGYYQFLMREKDIKFTAFQTPNGLYEYFVIPMGLSNAPAAYNRGITRILEDLSTICCSYFDDIYIFTKSKQVEEHVKAIDKVLSRLKEHKFYLKLSKCTFCASEIPCLGDLVGRQGIRIHPEKVAILQRWPLPSNKSELHPFWALPFMCRDLSKILREMQDNFLIF